LPAALPMIPTVQFSQEESSKSWAPGKLDATIAAFKARGCLWLQNVFSPNLIDSLRMAFLQDYAGYLTATHDRASVLVVGDKRLMIPVEVKGAFNQTELYANPNVSAVMKEMLGKDYRLGGFGVVAALPGADAQHIHRDHPALFGSPIDDFLPSFAVTMIVPLIDLDATTGATRVWEESHLARYDVANADIPLEKRPFEDPHARAGDCLLMDYRLRHAGLENRSTCVRPILYITYFRPWFRDYVNYRKHAALILGEGEYDKLPAELKPLFENAIGCDRRV
jgi:hypothetical protein